MIVVSFIFTEIFRRRFVYHCR